MEMQPDLIPTPAERTEVFLLRGRYAATVIKDAQRVVQVARENDVVERFTLPCALCKAAAHPAVGLRTTGLRSVQGYLLVTRLGVLGRRWVHGKETTTSYAWQRSLQN
jgi:hypothetical protein